MNDKSEVRSQKPEDRRRAANRPPVLLLPTACCLLSAVLLLLVLPGRAGAAQTGAARVRVAVLDFGETETGRAAASRVASALGSSPAAGSLSIVDRDLSSAAARGAGYAGSLNLSLREARDLGAAVACDFYLVGDAQVLRRSSSAAPVYFEA